MSRKNKLMRKFQKAQELLASTHVSHPDYKTRLANHIALFRKVYGPLADKEMKRVTDTLKERDNEGAIEKVLRRHAHEQAGKQS